MSETIFSKIIAGTIPCHKVYEDEKTLAFLDINPIQPGHTIVISKLPANYVWDLPQSDYEALMETVKKVALRLKSVTGQTYVGEKIIGVDVPHAHVQLIPFTSVAEYDAQPTNQDPDHAALAAMAKTLAF